VGGGKASALLWCNGEELRSRGADEVLKPSNRNLNQRFKSGREEGVEWWYLITSSGELYEFPKFIGSESRNDLPEEFNNGMNED